jgi:hypothetical protein
MQDVELLIGFFKHCANCGAAHIALGSFVPHLEVIVISPEQ